MIKILYAKAQLQLIALACAIEVNAEKKGWDKDPPLIDRGEDGRFGSGSKPVTNTVNDTVEATEKSVKESLKAIKTDFNKATELVGSRSDNLVKSKQYLNDEEKQRISDSILSPSGKKVRSEISSVLKEISTESTEVFDDATGEIEDVFESEDVEKAINSVLDIAGKSAQKVGEASLKAGKAITPAALILGGLTAVAATGGAAAVLMVGGAALAIKNYTVPNSQGRGGKQAAEAFLVDPKNRADWVGEASEYLKGATSNLGYTAGLHTAILATTILLAEIAVGVLTKHKEVYLKKLTDLTKVR